MYGTTIREKRLAKKMSLRELAEATTLDFGLLSKIENGLRVATIPQGIVIAKALDCSLGELVGEME